jgi:hypothetical protein
MDDPRFVNNVELAQVAFVRDEGEAEMVRGLLESAGIPSMIEGAGLFAGTRHGFNGIPVYGGSQKVMVHAHRLEEARAVIAAPLADEDGDDEFS